VPHLLLQPLVENAIRHGIGRHVGQGVITIVARRKGEHLDIDVSDDGKGFHEDHSPLREGVGLRNTRARLQHLYGAAHRIELTNGPDRGVTVHLTLPYRPFNQTGELSEAEMVVSET
jgi:sensor histidine kinase YesM